MDYFANVLLFIFCSVGMAHVIVDGSIMYWFRDWVKFIFSKTPWPWLGDVVVCYLCCGVWCGFFMGAIWISHNPLKILACGFAAGFLANFAAVVLNWLESQTVVNMGNNK